LLAKFAYNNIKYNIISVNLFYIYYGFHQYLKYKIKVDNNSFVLAAPKKIKKIFFKREMLAKC